MASAGFRAGTAALIWRGSGEVMAFERADHAGAWQVPQGGINPGETPIDAVWREVLEETGLGPADLMMRAEHPYWTVYTYVEQAARGSWLGQAQRWFHFAVRDDSVLPVPDAREFINWRWMWPEDLLAGIVGFKAEVYREVLVGREAHPAFAPDENP
jgi:putative (di)nucleoside polyphosphate hydrolase